MIYLRKRDPLYKHIYAEWLKSTLYFFIYIDIDERLEHALARARCVIVNFLFAHIFDAAINIYIRRALCARYLRMFSMLPFAHVFDTVICFCFDTVIAFV